MADESKKNEEVKEKKGAKVKNTNKKAEPKVEKKEKPKAEKQEKAEKQTKVEKTDKAVTENKKVPADKEFKVAGKVTVDENVMKKIEETNNGKAAKKRQKRKMVFSSLCSYMYCSFRNARFKIIWR